MYTYPSLANPPPDCKAKKVASGWLPVAVHRRTADRQIGSPFRRTRPIPANPIQLAGKAATVYRSVMSPPFGVRRLDAALAMPFPPRLQRPPCETPKLTQTKAASSLRTPKWRIARTSQNLAAPACSARQTSRHRNSTLRQPGLATAQGVYWKYGHR